jgi:light-regulated signal transduction histidine kinase (bacteriophytochrome)
VTLWHWAGARITCEQTRFEGVISVRKNGIAIPARLHGKSFKVFERLLGQEHSSSTSIGLATLKLGAERLGG